MRFERLRIGAFGRLRGLDTGPEALPDFVVVQGPNEAGKTTFFHFLGTMLYGFQPASREAHPYAPWEGGDIEGEARLKLGDGESWAVRRRLLSSPSGTLVRGGREEAIRNRPLPCVEHVPRDVFRNVFALTLAELAGLEGASWAAVQDRLLGALGAVDIRPARDVVAELDQEAGERWRRSRRGRQRVRVLREELLELRVRRGVALEKDRRIREVAAELGRQEAALVELHDARTAGRALLDRHRVLLPVGEQLRRIEALARESGDPNDLTGLPADPEARLAALSSTVQDAAESVARTLLESRSPRSRIEAFGDADEQLVRRAGRVETLVADALTADAERVRRGQLEQEIRDLRRRAENLAGELLEPGEGGGSLDAVRTLSPGRLREALSAYESAREEWRAAEEGARGLPLDGAAPPALLGWGSLVAGLAALLAGLLAQSLVATALAAPILAVGVWALLQRAAALKARDRHAHAHARLEAARAGREAGRRLVVEQLGSLPLRATHLGDPSPSLSADLERLQELLRDAEDRKAALSTLDENAARVMGAIEALCNELRLDVPPGPGAAAHVLRTRLRDAEARRAAATDARRELEQMARERARLEETIARSRTEREALESQLAGLGEGDPTHGLVVARARMEAGHLARRLLEELERREPRLSELVHEIREAEARGVGVLNAEALSSVEAEGRALDRKIEEGIRRVEALRRDLSHLQSEESVDAVESEILLLEETLSLERRERDRLWLTARLIERADQRFRAAHQPDILRRAGAHLERITQGRYRRILVGDERREGAFLLEGPGYGGPVPVAPPVSTGTREQVYLALRLAIMDHLDQNGERLPVFVDEAFVNWDPGRFERGLEVLTEVTTRRQVFLFTCHAHVAERAVGHGARVLRLGPPPI